MRKHPGRLGLPKQPLAQPFPFVCVGKIRETDRFDGDDPPDGGILGAVNHAGRPAAELVQNPVSADLIHADNAILSVRPISARQPGILRILGLGEARLKCLEKGPTCTLPSPTCDFIYTPGADPFLTIMNDVRITKLAMNTEATLTSKGQTTIPKPI